jgi:UrcA family protein
MNMNRIAPAPRIKALVGIAAVAAAAALACPVQAATHIVDISVPVNTADLDLTRPTDAIELYRRLNKAARAACSPSVRVDLLYVTDFYGCYERALGDAVKSINRPQVTMVYLSKHTLQDAEARGINVPSQLASR